MIAAGLPQTFDPNQAAREAFVWRGALPVKGFTRLVDLLVSTEGVVQVTLAAGFNAAQQPTATLTLAATLMQSCQRCLQPVAVVIDHAQTVAWVGEAELIRLDALAAEGEADLIDAVEYLPLPQPAAVDTLAFIEDELLLSLPIVPLHADCQLPAAAEVPDEAHPFAALAGLRRLN